MRVGLQEVAGLVSTLAVLGGLPAAIVTYERGRAAGPTRIVELTGVMKDGAWTDEEVTGATYWRKTYQPATVVLRVGEEVLLRLKSADVTHGFYVPDLGVGPVEVEPGHVVDVRLRADRPGEFIYYCTAVCGPCHHFMRGLVRVIGDGKPAVAAERRDCPHHASPPIFHSLAERGAHLFATKGCANCHGEAGRGGVRNPNYVKDTAPALDVLAERMMLFDKTEADLIVNLIEKRADLHALANGPPFPTFARFLAQYDAVRGVIRNGNPAAKKDARGPAPLQMPAWGDQISAEDIDAVIAYLIGRFRWEEE